MIRLLLDNLLLICAATMAYVFVRTHSPMAAAGLTIAALGFLKEPRLGR